MSSGKVYRPSFAEGLLVTLFVATWMALFFGSGGPAHIAKSSIFDAVLWYSAMSLALLGVVFMISRSFWHLEITDSGIVSKAFRLNWSVRWADVSSWCCAETEQGQVQILLKAGERQPLRIHTWFLNDKTAREIHGILKNRCGDPIPARPLFEELEAKWVLKFCKLKDKKWE